MWLKPGWRAQTASTWLKLRKKFLFSCRSSLKHFFVPITEVIWVFICMANLPYSVEVSRRRQVGTCCSSPTVNCFLAYGDISPVPEENLFLIKRVGLGHPFPLGKYLPYLYRLLWGSRALKLTACGVLRWVSLEHSHGNSLSSSCLAQWPLSASLSLPVARASVSWLTAAGWKGSDVFAALPSQWERQLRDGSWHQGPIVLWGPKNVFCLCLMCSALTNACWSLWQGWRKNIFLCSPLAQERV